MIRKIARARKKFTAPNRKFIFRVKPFHAFKCNNFLCSCFILFLVASVQRLYISLPPTKSTRGANITYIYSMCIHVSPSKRREKWAKGVVYTGYGAASEATKAISSTMFNGFHLVTFSSLILPSFMYLESESALHCAVYLPWAWVKDSRMCEWGGDGQEKLFGWKTIYFFCSLQFFFGESMYTQCT
jgi:hypothetical protein